MEASVAITEGFVDDAYAREIDAALPAGEGQTDDELRVDYLLQKIAEQEAAVLHVAEFTDRRVQMIQEHGEGQIQSHRKRIAWLTTQIKLHIPPTGASMEKRYGRKSLPLPHGTVGYRATGESIAVLDQDKAVAWAKANGLKTTVKESIGKTPLHDYVKSTGEEPDPDQCGFKVEKGTEVWFVKSHGGVV